MNAIDVFDEEIEQFKLRNLLKKLGGSRSGLGAGTSVISLIIPANYQISAVSKKLADEYGTASNIKSRVNRISVQKALVSVQQRLKLYRHVPNGLVIYCGNVILDGEQKDKKLLVDYVPFRPINKYIYQCGDSFFVEPLEELLSSDRTYGFIVFDGKGCMIATLKGNVKKIVTKFEVDLPKKHKCGGQSSARFGRLRIEARHNYLRKISENANSAFIKNSSTRPIVDGIIIAGIAEFKSELEQRGLLDHRLEPIIIKILDISYGGERGLDQAIELSSDTLSNVKIISERAILTKFMECLAQDNGKYCFGISETLLALEAGAVDTLLIWDEHPFCRYTLRAGDTTTVTYKGPNWRSDQQYEIIEKKGIVEWLVDQYHKNTKIKFISESSPEGSQFVRGFGGIGALLRYKFEPEISDEESEDGNEKEKESDEEYDDFL